MNYLLLLSWQCRVILYKPVTFASRRQQEAAQLPFFQAEKLKTFMMPLHGFLLALQPVRCNCPHSCYCTEHESDGEVGMTALKRTYQD